MSFESTITTSISWQTGQIAVHYRPHIQGGPLISLLTNSSGIKNFALIRHRLYGFSINSFIKGNMYFQLFTLFLKFVWSAFIKGPKFPLIYGLCNKLYQMLTSHETVVTFWWRHMPRPRNLCYRFRSAVALVGSVGVVGVLCVSTIRRW